MTLRMKGLLKGLRYISQIFEADNGSSDEEEEEMQIGLPTDVKHVAHIGWDGPSVSSPSWMQKNEEETSNPDQQRKSKPPEYASAPLNINKGEDHPKAKSAPKSISEELNRVAPAGGDLPDVPKPSRRRHTKSSTLDSSEINEISSDVAPKKSSRRHSTDLSEATTKPSRRSQNLSSGSSNGVVTDIPLVPKSSRKKKLKESSSSVSAGSTKGRRSRKESIDGSSSTSNIIPVSDPGSEPGAEYNNKKSTTEMCKQSSALNDLKLEEKVFDGLS